LSLSEPVDLLRPAQRPPDISAIISPGAWAEPRQPRIWMQNCRCQPRATTRHRAEGSKGEFQISEPKAKT
jgi:hypothetical protein